MKKSLFHIAKNFEQVEAKILTLGETILISLEYDKEYGNRRTDGDTPDFSEPIQLDTTENPTINI